VFHALELDLDIALPENELSVGIMTVVRPVTVRKVEGANVLRIDVLRVGVLRVDVLRVDVCVQFTPDAYASRQE
jgi:hypothetical protein